MAELILGPMLRHVTGASATIWLETDESCLVEILDHRVRTFSVAGHHYALVVIDGLTAGTSTEYDVRLDGTVHWPVATSTFPPSRIRTLNDEMTPRIMFGSCRTAAPHKAPWSLEFALDTKGRGVDAVYAGGSADVHTACRTGRRVRGVLLAVRRVLVATRRALVLLGCPDGHGLRRSRDDR